MFWGPHWHIPTPCGDCGEILHRQADPRARRLCKLEVNQCNESPLRCEKPDFWPVSKFSTGSLSFCGILPVKKTNDKRSKNVRAQNFNRKLRVN